MDAISRGDRTRLRLVRPLRRSRITGEPPSSEMGPLKGAFWAGDTGEVLSSIKERCVLA